MQTHRKPPLPALIATVAAAFVLAACGEKAADTAAQPAPPPPEVSVITATVQSVPMMLELPGRTAPFMIAELRPQVGGIIQKREFREGSDVKAGQVLYRIDPALFRASHDSAKANVARAEANLYAARVRAERYAGLVKIEAVSKQANDDAVAALKQAQAELAAAKAALDKARIDLDYTLVKSPIAGRIGRSAVTSGALVTANQPTPLATVQQLDPIYVDVTQSSAEMVRIRRELDAGKLIRKDGAVPVQLVLEDGSEYELPGTLAFSEATVDEGTGSVTLRAQFPNPRAELLPGMYVRARLSQGIRSEAILVPHAALSHDARGQAQVMVVDDENKVAVRPVQLAQSSGDQWVLTGGLEGGERVIVEGLQRVRPGVPVRIAVPPAAPAPAPEAEVEAAGAAH